MAVVITPPDGPATGASPDKVPAWVYRLDVAPPSRHEAWRRAMRILHVRRQPTIRRRRAG